MTFGLLDRDTETTPGVTAPRVTLSFGGGGGGALGGLAPDIGPFGASAGLETGVLSLGIARGFAPFVDWAEVHLRPPEGAGPLPTLGEAGTVGISLGDRATSFAGTLDSLEHLSDGSVRLGIGNGARALAQARTSTAFAEMSTGDIIAELCSEAGVDADASGGPSLPRYFADGGASVLDHVARLAASMGRLARFADDGKLELVDDAGSGEEIPVAAGDAILSARLGERVAAGKVRVTGAGGQDWAWLSKDAAPLQAEGGSGPTIRDVSAPWLRGPDGIEGLAAARGRALARDAAPGELHLAAYPDAQPGMILALSGTALDGPWRVMTSTLRLDTGRGFSNHVTLARADADAGALGLLGGLL
ncbi:hypothetical protein R5H30_12290 [Sulfitobacter sp. D35]|uniref:hypothetical protein n=1 Tax=Sulfitobacter sp. D35 TaxID=3083252 RepID=UPI0029700679|nr:hypothetical protein [Sulfitobacter sp. D35]MDW4498766.1 hypothetical protein [Sulfitobacter sp. D35]